MPPKSSKREGDGDVQGLLLEKDLEIETLLDKIFRLEKRSESLEATMEKQQIATKEMEEKLQDVITCLTGYLNYIFFCKRSKSLTEVYSFAGYLYNVNIYFFSVS